MECQSFPLPWGSSQPWSVLTREVSQSESKAQSTRLFYSLKPENVMVGDDGVTPKLCDFGLSQSVLIKSKKGIDND